MGLSRQYFILRWTYLRGLTNFHIIALAQLFSPAAAADPASRIVPPAWAHRHSREDLLAYGMRVEAQELETKSHQPLSRVALKRILKPDSPEAEERRMGH